MAVDKRIENKLRKIFHTVLERAEITNKLIIKYFKNINYQHDGDSLLHLIIKSNVIDEVITPAVMDIISRMISLGVNPNIRNKDGKTFLHLAIEKYASSDFLTSLLNNIENFGVHIDVVDNDNKTIFHYLVENFDAYPCSSYLTETISPFLNEKYRNALKIKDKDGNTILDLLKRYQDSYLEKEMEVNAGCSKVILDIMLFDIDEVADTLLKSDNIKKELRFLHVDYIGIFLEKIQQTKDDEKALSVTKKIIHIYPNLTWEGMILSAIKYHNVDYVFKIIDLCFEYRCELYEELAERIMHTAVENYADKNDLLKIYVFLAKKGYSYDILYPSPNVISTVKSLLYGNIGNLEINLNDYIRNVGFSMMLESLFMEKELQVNKEEIYNINFINAVFELIYYIKYCEIIIDDFNKNDYALAKLIVNQISEEISNSINYIDNPITAKDIICALKNIIIEKFEHTFNEILIKNKIKQGFEYGVNKILTKNKIN